MSNYLLILRFTSILALKKRSKIIFDRFFNASMLDMNWLKMQSLRLYRLNTNFYIITHSLNSGWLMF